MSTPNSNLINEIRALPVEVKDAMIIELLRYSQEAICELNKSGYARDSDEAYGTLRMRRIITDAIRQSKIKDFKKTLQIA